MTTRTKIAHNGIVYDIIETVTVKHDNSKFAELMRNNGIIATHGVRRPNGRKIYMLDEYANGTTGDLHTAY
tara:strand:+ start:289 stop:501 length:213 start_codon:yes stop_codon:yes gene_type:complete